MLRYCCLVLLFSLTISSCTKEFLDKKPDKSLVIPSTIKDYLALLDQADAFNNCLFWGEWGTDNITLEYQRFQSLSPKLRNAYIWEKDILQGEEDVNWNELYKQIYIANVVLDGISELKIHPSEEATLNFVKGMALYARGEAFYHLSQGYAPPYDSITSSQNLGVPLRLNSNLNEKSFRPSLEETYKRIIKDLTEALSLLPEQVEVRYKNRPSKPSAYAMLARIYLAMRKYNKALENADKCLQHYDVLLDYNTISPTAATRPFPRINPEILTDGFVFNMISFTNSILVDQSLYDSYVDNDLRKTIYFKLNPQGKPYFVGQYTGVIDLFGGPATDEMYLIRAECHARMGNKDAAMQDLNTLLRTRWKSVNGVSTYIDQTATDSDNALEKILVERRKELCFRGLRWTDLRRLNIEPRFAKTLTRELNGQTYQLPPKSPRYTYPIPENEIRLSGIQQNER